MGMYNSELETNSKDSISREKKRKTIRKAKTLSRIDDPKKLKRETKGLSMGQKRKINRLRKRILRKEARKSDEERLSKNKRNTENDDKKTNEEPNDPNARGLDKYRQEDLNKPEKITEKTFIDRVGRTMVKMKIITMKATNKVKKSFKLAMNLLGFGAFGTIMVGFLIVVMFSLLTFGGIVAVMLSHPEAIKELDEVGLLGNALELGNVAEDVTNAEGDILVKGKDGTTGGNFKWYGKDANFSGGGTETPTETPTEPGGLIGDTDSDKIWNYLKQLGFSEAASAGVMGNLMQESGLNPKAVQNNGRGPGTGLVQWEDGFSGRWNNLEKWAKANGDKDVWAVDTQLDFMYYEMTSDNWQANMFGSKYKEHYGINAGSGVASVEYFKKETDPERAMYIFEYAFERAGSPAFPNRIKYTSEIYAKYAGK